MIKWVYLQLILLSSQWARGLKRSQRERGLKPQKEKVFGFPSNVTWKSLKWRCQENKHAPGRRRHTHIFHSGAFWPNWPDATAPQSAKKPSDSPDFQAPAASDGTCYSPALPRQSSAPAHTSNSHSSPLTAASFTSPRSAGEMRFRDNNGCGGGPGSTMTDCRV